ncbi:class I SAM-dependent DNA methyltransferase [Burkholderia glumae]|uniref:class I SAM-dependent DNA methyltransferase n=1 Tax=Burkholderia glumae TaxID=337 RepID=UPI00031937AF|nr:DNA methyltransferase [Burkholderia glumae]PJO21641.1 class I SAM-dependent DNA methyltransferase [Burkholderia glumae AU6208]QHE10585.1 lactate dehydrogenase [Burkholderia glumae AU6208]
MNAVEIEAAVSELAEAPFDAAEFPYSFLTAFGNKDTTIARLRKGDTNKSDVPGGVLQRGHIHLATCAPGQVNATLNALRASPETAKGKAKFILATDGDTLEAEEIASGETIASEYAKFAGRFGFFLPLAGISPIREIKDSAIDIRATRHLNKLYLELLKENPDWATDERRQDMNHFMARLIFCFFAEDTGIFSSNGLFTKTIDQMSDAASGNTHEVISTIFHAMNVQTKGDARAEAKIPGWADAFPYVNGGLFGGSTDVPRFTRMARTYLLHAGHLDWHEINPDIFGSMIQAVADDEERGSLGMHYTSVPNILKVLNPLFLDDLRAQLEAAGDNKAKLLNLRKRMARIRVFDPACGSGNFLVIAYKQMRAIEAEINRRREEPAGLKSVIPLTNFRGIELRSFPAEIARLALIIAEYQCDVLYRGQMQAVQDFLPLDAENWITNGNALRLDWLALFDQSGTGVKVVSDDLFETPLDQPEIDFENEAGETYICGNPPYVGSNVKPPKGATKEQKERLKKEAESRKEDLKAVFAKRTSTFGTLDYVAGWFMKAVDFGRQTNSATAFVATNSICQGQQVPVLWPLIFEAEHEITFAHTSFKWKNLAAKNAGVTVVIVGLARRPRRGRKLFVSDKEETVTVRDVENINAYLVPARNVIVEKSTSPISAIAPMAFGNMPNDDGGLIIKSLGEAEDAIHKHSVPRRFIRPFLGSDEAIDGKQRYCVWVSANEYEEAKANRWLAERFAKVAFHRSASDRESTKKLAQTPYRFGEVRQKGDETPIIIPRHSSENRDYLPFALRSSLDIVADSASAMYDAPLWNVAIYSSRLHLAWIATVCGKLETRYRYSNTLGWNTFPVPTLTEQNKIELTQCAEDILLAREAHFPATIADLYDPDRMPEDLARAHERNDEVLERIYIGRRFRNDTERLEKLFDLYTKMTATETKPTKKTIRARKTAQ